MSLYSVIYPAFAIAMLYVYYFFSGKEIAFVTRFILNVQMFILGAAIACYGLDAFIFVYNKNMFCKLQLEKGNHTGGENGCDERNEGFLYQIAIFYVFWVPVWIACIMSMRRFLKQIVDAGRERHGGDMMD